MSRKVLIAVSLCLAVLVTYQVNSAEKAKKKLDLKNVKCVLVSKNKAKATASTDYKGGKVFFCCPNCCKKFATDKKVRQANAHKANHQLAQTGQAKLAKCVFTGKKLNPATKIRVAGVDICFCCNGCKTRVLEAKDQVACAFNDKAFAKGYTLPKKKSKK